MRNFLPKTLLQCLLCLLVAIVIIGTIPYTIVGFRFKDEVTAVKIRNLINSLQNVGDSATLNANAYGEIATSTRDTLNKHVNPAIDQIANRVNSTMGAVESKVLLLEPIMTSLTENSQEISSLIKRTNDRVNDEKGLIQATTALVDSVREVTGKELKDAVAELALAGKNVRIITETSEIKNLPKEIDALAKSLNKSAGSVEVILKETETTSKEVAGVTTDLHKISTDSATRFHSLLYPGPSPWYKKYLLTPLKEIGGITYLVVRLASGIN